MHIFIVDIYICPYVLRIIVFSDTPSQEFLLFTLQLVLPHENTQTIYSVCFSVGRAAEVLGRHSQITTPDVFKLSLTSQSKQYRISNNKGPNSMPFCYIKFTITGSCDFL